MPTNVIEVYGTLREDGTLVLDRKPELPPGRMTVTVRTIADYKQTFAWQFFQRVKAEREGLGIAPLRREDIEAYLASMRDDSEPGEVGDESRKAEPGAAATQVLTAGKPW